MMDLSRHWPAAAAVLMLLSAVASLSYLSYRNTGGRVVYAMDDAYIHMAVSKNLVRHGVWGVTSRGFTSSSSSIIWPVILSSAYLLSGVNEFAPLLLNIALAMALVCVTHALLVGHGLKPLPEFVTLAAVIFFTPVTAMVFTGMEHVLYAILCILFAHLSARTLSEAGGNSPGKTLPALAAALVMTRYEGLLMVLVVCILFIIRKRASYAMVLGAAGVLPAAAYGLFSVSAGWYFLPNSILMKSYSPQFQSLEGFVVFLARSGYMLMHTPHILMLAVSVLFLLIAQYDRRKGVWTGKQLLAVIFVATTLLHMEFADTGAFYRYDSYLVALGLFTLAVLLGEYYPEHPSVRIDAGLLPKQLAVAVLVVFIILPPFAVRTYYSLAQTPQRIKNIYDEHYHMGLFLVRFYQGRGVIAGDVGAINYLSDIDCVDVNGLATMETAALRRRGSFDAGALDGIARGRGMKIAILDDVDGKYVPESWVKVGHWALQENIASGGGFFSFYAVDPSEADALAENLRAFSPQVPESVTQSGRYAE